MTRLLLLAAVLTLGAWSLSTAQPTTGAAPAATAPAGEARETAFRDLLAGDFAKGAALLKSSADSGDLVAVSANKITADYLSVREPFEKERKGELAREEARVRSAMLAWRQHQALVESKLDKSLFAKAEVMAEAIAAADKNAGLGATSQPADLSKASRADLQQASKALTEAVELVKDVGNDWAKAYRASAEKLRAAVDDLDKAWSTAKLPEDQRKLRDSGEKVQDAMIDMGVLVSKEPLMVALSHTREARDLSGDAEAFMKQDWVGEVVCETEKRGDQGMKDGKWNDALAIYGSGGLGELFRGNAAYDEKLRVITQHVRVLSLYGKDLTATSGPASNPATRPATQTASGDDEEDDQPRWRDMVSGIDASMVRLAISEIANNYVEAPDYRKVAVAALTGVRALADTPTVEENFPSLKDKALRDEFLSRIDQQVQQVKDRSAVDVMDVKIAFNRVLDINAQTLALPEEVVEMEFADGATTELDEFTNMIWPHQLSDFEKRTRGSFFGIGVQIHKDPGKPIEVITPLPDTPAFRAGVLAGDQILKVDGKDTGGIDVDRVVKMIQGPRQTKVVLTLLRTGRPKPFDVVVERDEIHIETIKGWRRLEDGKWDYMIDPAGRLGYIRMTQFTADTAPALQAALASLKADGCKGLVLDLRFNPGGLLDSAVQVADEFLAQGAIVSTAGRVASRANKWTATDKGSYQDGNLVVLVNDYSASAAEIVSGALKDWGRAKIIGTRSYGKGSVQRLIPLGENAKAEIKLTTAHYYLPMGRCLHRTKTSKEWGVDPDVAVPVTLRQTNRWAEVRQETDLLKNLGGTRLADLLNEQLTEDIQLQTALLVLKLEQIQGGTVQASR